MDTEPVNTELLKLEPNEMIQRTVRKHWFILFSRTFGIILAGLVPYILLAIFLSSDTLAALFSGAHVNSRLVSFFAGAWFLVVWMALFGIWTDYYLDMWIITNMRLIAIDQQGFFRRSVASFRFERLQDVTVEIHGFIPTLLDFGRIKADTAGHTDSFDIWGVLKPREIKSLIQEHADQVVMAPMPQSTYAPEQKEEPMP